LALFEKTYTPSFEVREKLANQLNMTNREVQVNKIIRTFFFVTAAWKTR
jgi:ribosomal protein S24E